MARVRSIANPHKEGKHVTLAEARSAFRELSHHKKAKSMSKDALNASARVLQKAAKKI